MALTKVQAGGINLADTFAFTGTVSGTRGLVLLTDTTVSSAVASVDITSFSSTYDSYQLVFYFLAVSDNLNFEIHALVGGSLVTDNHHAYQNQTSDGGAIVTVTADNLFARPNRYGVGKSSGEGISGNAIIQNVNNTNVGYSILGKVNEYVYNGDHTVMTDFGGSAKPSYKANVLSGIRFQFSSGNIEGGNVQLYGIIT